MILKPSLGVSEVISNIISPTLDGDAEVPGVIC